MQALVASGVSLPDVGSQSALKFVHIILSENVKFAKSSNYSISDRDIDTCTCIIQKDLTN